MKKALFFLFALLASIFTVGAADYYTVYQTDFSNEVTDSVFVSGLECTDTNCYNTNNNEVELYNGNEAVACWNKFVDNGKENKFISCMEDAKVEGNIHPIENDGDFIVTKINTDSSFGYITYFSPEGDSYVPTAELADNYVCDYEICFDTQIITIDFTKIPTAIAELGQVNIKNIDNPNKPVQVEVPVTIEETVCSAFRFNDANLWRPLIPQGYSDFPTLPQPLASHQALTI